MDMLFELGWAGHLLLLAAEEASAVEAESGGLFDFGGTLVLQIVNFLLLMTILSAVFYGPISRVIEERSEYIRSNAGSAQRRFDEAKALADQYEQELRTTRLEAQQVITAAEAEAQKIRAQQLAEAQREAQERIAQAQADLDRQKQVALASLSGEVEAISRTLSEKLLSDSARRF